MTIYIHIARPGLDCSMHILKQTLFLYFLDGWKSYRLILHRATCSGMLWVYFETASSVIILRSCRELPVFFMSHIARPVQSCCTIYFEMFIVWSHEILNFAFYLYLPVYSWVEEFWRYISRPYAWTFCLRKKSVCSLGYESELKGVWKTDGLE